MELARSVTNYQGPEGHATYLPDRDLVDVWATIEGEVIVASLDRDGRLWSLDSQVHVDQPTLFISASGVVERTAEEAERVKAFLRSMGFSLPHVK